MGEQHRLPSALEPEAPERRAQGGGRLVPPQALLLGSQPWRAQRQVQRVAAEVEPGDEHHWRRLQGDRVDLE